MNLGMVRIFWLWSWNGYAPNCLHSPAPISTTAKKSCTAMRASQMSPSVLPPSRSTGTPRLNYQRKTIKDETIVLANLRLCRQNTSQQVSYCVETLEKLSSDPSASSSSVRDCFTSYLSVVASLAWPSIRETPFTLPVRSIRSVARE